MLISFACFWICDAYTCISSLCSEFSLTDHSSVSHVGPGSQTPHAWPPFIPRPLNVHDNQIKTQRHFSFNILVLYEILLLLLREYVFLYFLFFSCCLWFMPAIILHVEMGKWKMKGKRKPAILIFFFFLLFLFLYYGYLFFYRSWISLQIFYGIMLVGLRWDMILNKHDKIVVYFAVKDFEYTSFVHWGNIFSSVYTLMFAFCICFCDKWTTSARWWENELDEKKIAKKESKHRCEYFFDWISFAVWI